MFLALHHSAHAAINHVLVARAMFLEAVVLLTFISEISLSDTRENELNLLPLSMRSVEQNDDFRWRKY